MMKIYYGIGLLAIILSTGCIQPQESTGLEWEKIGGDTWRATDKNCLEEKPVADYLCISNCFEKSREEIWEYCGDKGYAAITDTGIEVLCFYQGCFPQISDGECEIICPL